MLDNQKTQELECLVLGGFCPKCHSVDIQYREYEENQKFCFKCFRCGWKGKYTSEELNQASSRWNSIQAQEEMTDI
jgi:Zn ribbon nucleic-acid-binding protein